jgi:hypothetical protein
MNNNNRSSSSSQERMLKATLQWEPRQSFLPNDTEGNGAEDVKYTDTCLLSDKNLVRDV